MTLTCFLDYFFNSNFSIINLSNSIFVIISDVEVELISTCESLENLNLEENPLTRDCQDNLSFIAKKQILMTPRELEEWEDLSIEKWKKQKTWKLWKKNNQRKIFLNILDDVKICAKIINILWSYLTKYPTYCIEELYNESKKAKYGQKWLNITFSDEASSQVCLISYPSLFKSFFTS